jgi:hypothetical protein
MKATVYYPGPVWSVDITFHPWLHSVAKSALGGIVWNTAYSLLEEREM